VLIATQTVVLIATHSDVLSQHGPVEKGGRHVESSLKHVRRAYMCDSSVIFMGAFEIESRLLRGCSGTAMLVHATANDPST
jgi:hypothetical protein